MTALAVYILEQAQKAHGEQLSEQEFLADFDQRSLGATKVRLPNIGEAITEIRQGGQWPWPDPSEPPDREPKDQERDELPALRAGVMAAMCDLTAASQDLTYLFGRLGLDMGGDAIGQIERGANALEVVRSMGLADRRETLQAAAFRLQKSRHEFQREMFRLSAAEGESLAEIARPGESPANLSLVRSGNRANPGQMGLVSRSDQARCWRFLPLSVGVNRL